MRASPLLLEQYIITELHVSAQSDFKLTAEDAGKILPQDLQVEVVEGRHEENSRLRSCQLTVELEDSTGDKFPYTFLISLVGFFEIIKEWPESQVDILFSANAPALLYSAARESLAMITARGPYAEALLPSVTFIQPPSKEQAEPERKALPAAKSKQASKGTNRASKKTTQKSTKK